MKVAVCVVGEEERRIEGEAGGEIGSRFWRRRREVLLASFRRAEVMEGLNSMVS